MKPTEIAFLTEIDWLIAYLDYLIHLDLEPGMDYETYCMHVCAEVLNSIACVTVHTPASSP